MGALDGVKVLDLGQWLAGPLAAMLLADQGAEVVRVERPDAPEPAPLRATVDRGKRRVVLDLRRAADVAVARRLAASADVVVEGFRPGVMERLGLGAAELTWTQPRLVHCALPGFAADDPRAGLAAWEGVLGAATGAYWQPEGPRFTALPIASAFGALAAAVAIVMALVARERDGLGQRIEVPLFDATLLAVGAGGLLVDGRPDGGRPDDPWGGQFQCADGRWVRLSLATFRFLRRFVDAAGRADWIAAGYVHPERPGPLPRGSALRAAQERALRELFLARPAAEWEALGRRADVPLTLIRTSAEWLETEHARAAGLVADVADPELGPMRQAGLAVRLLGTPGAVRPRRPVEAAAAVAFAPVPGPPAAPATARLAAALEGVRVVDLSQVLAGPTAGRTLAEFGADVVKINNPREEGAGYRWQVHRYHTDVNRGKRTLLLDLAHPAGLDVFHRLVDGADVVLQNFRPGVAERLGVGEAQVRARRPGIVYGTVAFLGAGGPWETAPGYEPNAQAAAGMAARMGGKGGVPALQPFAVNDYGTGLLGAFAVGLGLFHRLRTGKGQHVQASLAATATFLQLPYLERHAGKAWDEPAGAEALGWGPLQRCHRAADGWLFLGATEAQRDALGAVEGLGDVAGREGAALEAALAAALATRPAAEWTRRLAAAGGGAPAGGRATDLMTDPWVVAHGLSVTRTGEDGAAVTTIGPPARLSRTPATPGRHVARPGADAPAILADLGLHDRLPTLVAKGVITSC